MRYWELIADNLSNAGWSWGCVAAIDCEGRTIFVADAHRDDGRRFVTHADEKLTAFLELESAIRVWLGLLEIDRAVIAESWSSRKMNADAADS